MSRYDDGCSGGGPCGPARAIPESIAESAKSPGLQAGIRDLDALKKARVVDGHLVYKGKVKVQRQPSAAVCEETSFCPPVYEDPSIFAENLAGDYDGVFPEITEYEVSTKVKVDGPIERKSRKAPPIEARYSVTGRIVAESPLDCSSVPRVEADGEDLFAPYEQRLVNFIMVISSLSGNCASYVVEDVRRLLYLRDGKISRSSLVAARKEACKSLARLASLRKALIDVADHDNGFSASSADALLELGASLRGALAYRSSDVAVVLDFNSLSQLEVAAYSTHRLLGDIGEVLRAYCPWLIYKIVVYKFLFAKDLLWELLRQFLLHTLGGFNESSLLRCRRPAYRLGQPPQPLGSGEWLPVEDTNEFWDEMRKLHEEAPWALPEPDPVDDVAIAEPEDSTALARVHTEEERVRAMEYKAKELEELINRTECLVPHFNKAVKQVLTLHECAIAERQDLLVNERSRPPVDLQNVTRSDVRVCMWKPPAGAADAAQGTAQTLLRLLEKRRQWTRPPLPANYMHAFERTTYSLDCVYVSGRR
ncbi:hypothetical protein ACSSS7_005381 [Eimeria intestinalis]